MEWIEPAAGELARFVRFARASREKSAGGFATEDLRSVSNPDTPFSLGRFLMFFLLAVAVTLLLSVWLLVRMDIRESNTTKGQNFHFGD
jgi:hypothetical protein